MVIVFTMLQGHPIMPQWQPYSTCLNGNSIHHTPGTSYHATMVTVFATPQGHSIMPQWQQYSPCPRDTPLCHNGNSIHHAPGTLPHYASMVTVFTMPQRHPIMPQWQQYSPSPRYTPSCLNGNSIHHAPGTSHHASIFTTVSHAKPLSVCVIIFHDVTVPQNHIYTVHCENYNWILILQERLLRKAG